MSQGGNSADPTHGENDCKICEGKVGNKEKALSCDICLRWVHIDCVKIPQAVYGTLKKNTACPGLKWLCEQCEKCFGKLRVEIKEIMDKQVELEKQQDNLESKVAKISTELEILRREMTDLGKSKVNEDGNTQVKVVEEIGDLKQQVGELNARYSNALRGNLEENSTLASNSILSSHTRTIVGEALEREKRKNNLVLFGIEETHDQQATKDKVNDLITLVGVDVNKVKYFGRVGRYIEGARARAVRVVCDDAETKRNLLKAAIKLKSETGYERTYISPDLTKEQQVQDKKLREKLREIRTHHKEAKINHNEIIIMEDGSRKVLYSVSN